MQLGVCLTRVGWGGGGAVQLLEENLQHGGGCAG